MIPTRVGILYQPPKIGVEFKEGETFDLKEISFEELQTDFNFSAAQLKANIPAFDLIDVQQLDRLIQKLKQEIGSDIGHENEEEDGDAKFEEDRDQQQEQEEDDADSYEEDAFELEEEELDESFEFDDIEEEDEFETFEEASQDSEDFFG